MPPRTPSSRAWRSRPTAPCGCSTSPTRMSCRTRSCRAAGWCASRPGLPTPSTPAPASWDWATPPASRTPRGVAKQIEERTSRREREAKTLVLQAALDDLVGWLRDCLLVGAGGDAHILPIVHVDAVMELREEAEALSAAVLLAAIDRVLDTRLALESNVGTTLALEAMLLDLSTLVMVGVSG